MRRLGRALIAHLVDLVLTVVGVAALLTSVYAFHLPPPLEVAVAVMTAVCAADLCGLDLSDRVDAALNRTVRRFAGIGPMPEPDRTLWMDARTVRDAGRLIAMWLDGRIDCQPGYNLGQPCRPDEETTPLAPLLAAVNRAGFYTTNMQSHDAAGDGTPTEASVEGFADEETSMVLTGLLHGSGLRWSCAVSYSRRTDIKENVGRGWWYGHDKGEIHDQWGHDCHDDLVFELTGASQFHIEDPEPGSTQLWDILQRFAAMRGQFIPVTLNEPGS